jgi:hypothetical protein
MAGKDCFVSHRNPQVRLRVNADVLCCNKAHNVLYKHHYIEAFKINNYAFHCKFSSMGQQIIALYILLNNGIIQFVKLALITIISHIKRRGVLCGHPVKFN